MKKSDVTKTIILTLIIGVFMLSVGLATRDFDYAKTVYQVYLNGNKLGIIESKDELYALINEEQKEIKENYHVENVYPPNGFVINEYNTYDDNLTTAKDIYETIKGQEDFTIEGYTIKIKFNDDSKKEDLVLYVLDEEIFKKALLSVITAFVNRDDFYAYINNEQTPISDVGSIIEDMYFEETITIKPSFISVNEKIYTDAIELSQYLLFGSNTPNEQYIVKKGDTISSISSANKLNTQEFLIANPTYKDENSILTINDKVNITLINPILTLVESVHTISDEEQNYETETVYDSLKSVSFSEVTQTGITGIERISKTTKIVNGEQNQGVDSISSVTIREAQKEIVTKGGFPPKGHYVDNGKVWGWPTNRPYIITTGFEWRWGDFHNALDISGTGMGSPIYASRGGTVVEINNTCANVGSYRNSCGRTYGNFVIISHGENYYTMYAHLLQNVEVNPGDTVTRGQVIGYMGSSGSSTGAHLHFGVSKGYPDQGSWLNPWSVFR